jgi:hypothetical protein
MHGQDAVPVKNFVVGGGFSSSGGRCPRGLEKRARKL